MQFWSFYFLGKLFLDFMGAIRFDFPLNIVFAGLLLFIAEKFPKSRALKALSISIGIPAGFLLFWHETNFPALGYAFRSLTGPNAMSAGYILQFVLQSVNPWVLAGLIVLFIFCFQAAKRFDLAIPVILLMLIILPFRASNVQMTGEYLKSFHKSEAGRTVGFERTTAGAPVFDILILHI